MPVIMVTSFDLVSAVVTLRGVALYCSVEFCYSGYLGSLRSRRENPIPGKKYPEKFKLYPQKGYEAKLSNFKSAIEE